MIADLNEYGRAPTRAPHAPPANDEPQMAEHPRSWIVVCKGLGLINIVAESAEELVKRLHAHRLASAEPGPARLVSFDVTDNTDDVNQAVIWFDPALVQAVLSEYKPPVPKRRLGPLEEAEAEVVAPEAGLVVVESESDE